VKVTERDRDDLYAETSRVVVEKPRDRVDEELLAQLRKLRDGDIGLKSDDWKAMYESFTADRSMWNQLLYVMRRGSANMHLILVDTVNTRHKRELREINVRLEDPDRDNMTPQLMNQLMTRRRQITSDLEYCADRIQMIRGEDPAEWIPPQRAHGQQPWIDGNGKKLTAKDIYINENARVGAALHSLSQMATRAKEHLLKENAWLETYENEDGSIPSVVTMKYGELEGESFEWEPVDAHIQDDVLVPGLKIKVPKRAEQSWRSLVAMSEETSARYGPWREAGRGQISKADGRFRMKAQQIQPRRSEDDGRWPGYSSSSSSHQESGNRQSSRIPWWKELWKKYRPPNSKR
jgi:hypothetical protein